MPVVLHDSRQAAQWLAARCTGVLRTDSRAVRPGDAFIAWPGRTHDARGFVASALAAGAAACLVEAQGAEAFGAESGLADARVGALPGLKAAAGAVAAAFLGEPGRRLQVVAATGTNGKTSTAWWVAQALARLGRRCGVIGTLGVGEPGDAAFQATGLTTPDPVALQQALRRFADGGCTACAVEASSIGLVEHRLAGTPIEVAVFTNFTRDHLDYHGTMEQYWAAKRLLFSWPGLRAAVVNVDDPAGQRLAGELQGGPLDVWTVGARVPARLQARQARIVDDGLAFEVQEGDTRVAVRSRLVGDYNVQNLLGVLGVLRALDVPLAEAAALVPQLQPVPGRMQRVEAQDAAPGPQVIVDYAHTPDALEKVLQSLRPLAAARGGELWCVFGCGGDRDASKRPLMGAIAARLARRVVVTSDNPRREAPAAIMRDVLAGIDTQQHPHTAVQAVEDRREAILQAVMQAATADVVLVAGKGHETTQEIGAQRLPFSDVAEAAGALRARQALSQRGVAA